MSVFQLAVLPERNIDGFSVRCQNAIASRALEACTDISLLSYMLKIVSNPKITRVMVNILDA